MDRTVVIVENTLQRAAVVAMLLAAAAEIGDEVLVPGAGGFENPFNADYDPVPVKAQPAGPYDTGGKRRAQWKSEVPRHRRGR